MMNTEELLFKSVELKASDLHITAGISPMVRVHGRLVPMGDTKLLPQDTEQIVKALTSETQWNKLNKVGEVDFSYSILGKHRFRVNAYRQRGSYSAALRLINSNILSFEELELPMIARELTEKNSGLILVTGPTGSGKSTTLACMVNSINETRDRHIITLEDPIEYLFTHKKSVIEQREVGIDTMSFSNALKASLREDPDVILVGEMRDYETISIALTAAETGHLVFSTLHTVGAASTVDRIIDVFPSHQQQQIRIQLAMTLQGIISQQLLTKRDQQGRVVAVEAMVANTAIRNIIREGKAHQINNVLQTNAKSGMRTMDDALCELFRQGQITREDALSYSIDSDYMKRMINSK
jgi:twitching motility protein PilT